MIEVTVTNIAATVEFAQEQSAQVTLSSSSSAEVTISAPDQADVTISAEVIDVTIAPTTIVVELQASAGAVVQIAENGLRGQYYPTRGNATFTWVDGVITRIDYEDGSYLTLMRTNGRLTQIDDVTPTLTTRNTIVYAGDLISQIQETVF